MILTEAEIKSCIRRAGFRGIDLNAAARIAFCESSWNPSAHNTQGEDSRGLFQINVNAHPQYLSVDLFDPQINCNIAYELYSKRNNTFQDWTCAHMLGLVDPGKKNIIDPVVLPLALFAFGIGIVLYLTS